MSHITKLTAEDMQQANLPEMVNLLVSLIGAESTATLINQLGGTTFPVSKNQIRAGKIRFAMLADVIGDQDATILTKYFGGEVIYIPRCHELFARKRNRQIRNDFDQMTTDYTACEAVMMLSIKYRMADRTIWGLLKQA